MILILLQIFIKKKENKYFDQVNNTTRISNIHNVTVYQTFMNLYYHPSMEKTLYLKHNLNNKNVTFSVIRMLLLIFY